MSNTVQLRRGPVVWVADLQASTASTVFPTGATAGIAPPSNVNVPSLGDRVHVAVIYTAVSGTMSTDVHLYGYGIDGSALANQDAWFHLGSMNSGSSLVSTSPYGNGFRVAKSEYFVASGQNYSRYATRCINPQGGTPIVSTWIGFENA